MPRPDDIVQASVLAGTGASAEALTKAVLVGGDADSPDRLDRHGVGVLAVHADGCLSANTTWRRHRATVGRGGGVNEQFWWYLARSAGMAAAALMVGALVLGVLAATRALKDIDRPAWLVALHRWFSVLTAIAVVTHLVALVADSYVHFGLAELLVPGTSSWRPLAVSLGVVALYLFVVVHVSSLAMKRLPKVWWRRLHALSYLSVWAAIMHAGHRRHGCHQRGVPGGRHAVDDGGRDGGVAARDPRPLRRPRRHGGPQPVGLQAERRHNAGSTGRGAGRGRSRRVDASVIWASRSRFWDSGHPVGDCSTAPPVEPGLVSGRTSTNASWRSL